MFHEVATDTLSKEISDRIEAIVQQAEQTKEGDRDKEIETAIADFIEGKSHLRQIVEAEELATAIAYNLRKQLGHEAGAKVVRSLLVGLGEGLAKPLT